MTKSHLAQGKMSVAETGVAGGLSAETLIAAVQPFLLSGEALLHLIHSVHCVKSPLAWNQTGTIYVTNYKVLFLQDVVRDCRWMFVLFETIVHLFIVFQTAKHCLWFHSLAAMQILHVFNNFYTIESSRKLFRITFDCNMACEAKDQRLRHRFDDKIQNQLARVRIIGAFTSSISLEWSFLNLF